MSEYPHMCRDGHEEIGFSNSEIELCPVCDVMGQLGAARAEIERVHDYYDCKVPDRVRYEKLEAERIARENAERELARMQAVVEAARHESSIHTEGPMLGRVALLRVCGHSCQCALCTAIRALGTKEAE